VVRDVLGESDSHGGFALMHSIVGDCNCRRSNAATVHKGHS
jgi:hypothetical protein